MGILSRPARCVCVELGSLFPFPSWAWGFIGGASIEARTARRLRFDCESHLEAALSPQFGVLKKKAKSEVTFRLLGSEALSYSLTDLAPPPISLDLDTTFLASRSLFSLPRPHPPHPPHPYPHHTTLTTTWNAAYLPPRPHILQPISALSSPSATASSSLSSHTPSSHSPLLLLDSTSLLSVPMTSSTTQKPSSSHPVSPPSERPLRLSLCPVGWH